MVNDYLGDQLCLLCGYVYAAVEHGVPLWLQEDWVCPLCGGSIDCFEPIEEPEEEWDDEEEDE